MAATDKKREGTKYRLQDAMTRLYLALPGARAHLAQSRALLGFDAFIDIVARPLREGSADGAGQAFNLLPDFGAFVSGRVCSHSEQTEDLRSLGPTFAILRRLSSCGRPHAWARRMLPHR